MKIALINENSQAAKNELILTALRGVVEPMGHTVDNYGMYTAQDTAQLTYVQAGIPYAWGGGHGPTPGISGGISDGGGHADAMGDYNKQGLDCSGFARAVHYDATGSDDLHGTAAMQYDMTEPVHPDDARPGDLYFPDSAGRPPGHVQVYVGGDQVAEAQQSGTNIMYSDLQPGEFRRVPGY